MSRLTMSTRHLVGMMQDAALTASKEPLFPEICSVLLHSTRAEIPLEDAHPGGEDDDDTGTLIDYATTDVLVATSSDRTIIGQSYAPCTGQFHQLVLITAAGAKAIVQVFDPLRKAAAKTAGHEVVLELSGGVLVVRENPAKVQSPVSLTLDVLDEEIDSFPHFDTAMQPDPGAEVKRDGKVVPATYGVGLDPNHLATLARVSKRRKMPIAWYGFHQLRPVVVTVGSWYRAAVLPASHELEDEQLAGPQVPVFSPEWPTRSAEQSPPLVSVG
jgi:hypothetical protein